MSSGGPPETSGGPDSRRVWLPPSPASEQQAASETEPETRGLHTREHGRLKRPGVTSGSDVTQPRMLAVRPSVPPRLSYHPLFDDQESTTEVSELRNTEYGEPPEALVLRDRALLLRMDGVEAGRVYALQQERVTIGRHPSSTLKLEDDGISRQHARIEHAGGTHLIEDLGSRNGTFVQGRSIERAELRDGDWIQLGPQVGFRYTLTDVRQEKLLHQLYESSTRDALTGAHNRKHFDERLKTEVAFVRRHHTNLGLALIDIDHFKDVNDTYGHPAGDAVLKQVAAQIARTLRMEDVFARFGGEEFAVILRGSDRLGSARLAERLRATVAALPATVQNRAIGVTVSVGVASLSCCQEPSPAQLVATADRRLYEAKRAGRNRVVASD